MRLAALGRCGSSARAAKAQPPQTTAAGIQSAFGDDKIQVRPTRTAEIGASIFTRFVLPFEVVSVLLLAALIGAIVLARKDDTE